MTFNPTLTIKDKALAKAFMARLKENHKAYFTSDDFRGYKLDALLDDPAHEVGAFFAKLKFHGFVVAAGEEASQIESNNRRKVDLWRWHHRVEGWLRMKPIDAFADTTLTVQNEREKKP